MWISGAQDGDHGHVGIPGVGVVGHRGQEPSPKSRVSHANNFDVYVCICPCMAVYVFMSAYLFVHTYAHSIHT